MSRQSRPISTPVLVCDLCDKVIDETEPDTRGSLTYGYGNNITPSTKWVFFRWPPFSKTRTATWEQRREMVSRDYDFHTDCILRVVENAIESKKQPEQGGQS